MIPSNQKPRKTIFSIKQGRVSNLLKTSLMVVLALLGRSRQLSQLKYTSKTILQTPKIIDFSDTARGTIKLTNNQIIDHHNQPKNYSLTFESLSCYPEQTICLVSTTTEVVRVLNLADPALPELFDQIDREPLTSPEPTKTKLAVIRASNYFLQGFHGDRGIVRWLFSDNRHYTIYLPKLSTEQGFLVLRHINYTPYALASYLGHQHVEMLDITNMTHLASETKKTRNPALICHLSYSNSVALVEVSGVIRVHSAELSEFFSASHNYMIYHAAADYEWSDYMVLMTHIKIYVYLFRKDLGYSIQAVTSIPLGSGSGERVFKMKYLESVGQVGYFSGLDDYKLAFFQVGFEDDFMNPACGFENVRDKPEFSFTNFGCWVCHKDAHYNPTTQRCDLASLVYKDKAVYGFRGLKGSEKEVMFPQPPQSDLGVGSSGSDGIGEDGDVPGESGGLGSGLDGKDPSGGGIGSSGGSLGSSAGDKIPESSKSDQGVDGSQPAPSGNGKISGSQVSWVGDLSYSSQFFLFIGGVTMVIVTLTVITSILRMIFCSKKGPPNPQFSANGINWPQNFPGSTTQKKKNMAAKETKKQPVKDKHRKKKRGKLRYDSKRKNKRLRKGPHFEPKSRNRRSRSPVATKYHSESNIVSHNTSTRNLDLSGSFVNPNTTIQGHRYRQSPINSHSTVRKGSRRSRKQRATFGKPSPRHHESASQDDAPPSFYIPRRLSRSKSPSDLKETRRKRPQESQFYSNPPSFQADEDSFADQYEYHQDEELGRESIDGYETPRVGQEFDYNDYYDDHHQNYPQEHQIQEVQFGRSIDLRGPASIRRRSTGTEMAAVEGTFAAPHVSYDSSYVAKSSYYNSRDPVAERARRPSKSRHSDLERRRRSRGSRGSVKSPSRPQRRIRRRSDYSPYHGADYGLGMKEWVRSKQGVLSGYPKGFESRQMRRKNKKESRSRRGYYH